MAKLKYPKQTKIYSRWQDDDGDFSPRILRIVREHKGVIVVTNGCFDLLHPGHVHLLTSVKTRLHLPWDRVFFAVLINNDASVASLKGPHRPVLPFEHRAAVVAGIKGVDWVLGFEERTPETLLQLIEPNILVKGSSFMGDIVPGQADVIRRGGQMLYIQELEEWSTTTVLQGLRRRQPPIF